MYFSPGPAPGSSGMVGGFLEGELQGAEAVAERGGVVVAEGGGGGVEEAGEGVDQGAGLVQVLVVGQVLGQAEVDGGGAHQVQGGGGDDLDARYVGDVARNRRQWVGLRSGPGSVMLLLLHGDRPGPMVTPEWNTRGSPVVQV